jgi:hypothetical protein
MAIFRLRHYSWLQACRHLSLAAGVGAAGVGAVAWPIAAFGQSAEMYFPPTSGYDEQPGVTVQSRERPLYATPGIIYDSFNISPKLDQSVLYNSNPTGIGGPGSWGSVTSAALTAGSLWSRNGLAISLGADHYQYFALPDLDHTNWNVGVVGGYTIGDSELVLAYSHQAYYQLGTSYTTARAITPVLGPTTVIEPATTGTQTTSSQQAGQLSSFQPVTTLGTVGTTTPLLDQTDTAQVNYTFNFGRIAITPDVSASAYRFGSATVLGTPLNQDYLNRNALAGGITTRYSFTDVSSAVLVVRAIDNVYTNSQPGLPTNNSQNYILLGGIDFQPKGQLRYRLLGGLELSTFAAAQYATVGSPIVEGSVTWTPTGLTTVTGSVYRLVQAPQSQGTAGFVLSSVRLVVDHELRRNVLLQARGSAQLADYFQGGSQTNYTFGAGVSWLFNRYARLSLDYDAIKQSGTTGFSNPASPNTVTLGAYNDNLAALTLHVGL